MTLNFYSQLTTIFTPFITSGSCIINETEFKTTGKMRCLRFPQSTKDLSILECDKVE